MDLEEYIVILANTTRAGDIEPNCISCRNGCRWCSWSREILRDAHYPRMSSIVVMSASKISQRSAIISAHLAPKIYGMWMTLSQITDPLSQQLSSLVIRKTNFPIPPVDCSNIPEVITRIVCHPHYATQKIEGYRFPHQMGSRRGKEALFLASRTR